MNNIVSFLEEYGDLNFEEMPFTESDALLLCQMAYFDFGGFVGSLSDRTSGTQLTDIVNSPSFENLFVGYWYHDDNVKLMQMAANSVRYSGMKLCFYDTVVNEEKDAQFGAITFILEDKSVFVAFRGTDATLLGWKEDMKLAYSKPIRSQELAVSYLNEAASKFLGRFRVGGHSKGGNLAVYACMNCLGTNRQRILDVYDFDGPGFRPEIITEGHFEAIKDRVHKFIPKSSIVGIILENELDYEVIESWGVGTLQHNTYTWKSEKGILVRSSGMREMKVMKDKSLNEWVLSLSEEEVSTFIDVLYDMLTASDAKSIFDLIKNPKKSISSAFEAYKDLSPESKEALGTIWERLMSIVGENAMEEWLAKKRSIKEGVRTWQEDASQLMSQVLPGKKA